ncbi:MAG: DDE-type integrase/transposase/recombinase [Patescibacteria group bacterium]|nr:DDE-type integrase/transposase/recombinase [Patescibacteria group bacterium]MCL5095766.1 DDE-type integrase/transposase/recombinase [Patescibacteria group bacterium]
MRLRYLWPKGLSKQVHLLSREGRKKLEWMDWYLTHGKNARATCRHFSLSPDTFYGWKKRFRTSDLKSLEDNHKTRRLKHLREMVIPLWLIDKVVNIRRNDPEKSKYEIKEELKREGVKLGSSTIQKIINRHPDLLNCQHVNHVRNRRRLAITRIKAARELKDKDPGSLVQIDTKHLYILGQRFYLFAAIDSFSRMGYISCYQTGSSLSARFFLEELKEYFPLDIKAIQTDNGSEYLLNFHQACQGLGLTHYFTDPYCPKQNGRVERFIQTATYEFFNWQDDLLDDILMLKESCQRFNIKYNNERFNQALNYLTPKEYLQERQAYVI